MKLKSTNWLPTVLGEHIEITSGFAFQSNHFNNTGSLPIARIRDVKRGFSETYYTGKYDEKYLIQNGDLLVGMDGEFNAALWSGGQALLNQRVCRIKTLETLDFDFLRFLLPIELKKIEDRTPFVTVKHISTEQIKSIEFLLPPLEEQRRIAAILDKADAVRRKRKEAIALTEELLRSAFLDMFGDPVTNPKGWDIVSLGDISKVQGGLQVTTKRHTNPIEVPYLRVANVYRDQLVLDEIKFIRVTQQELERAALKIGDLLVVEGHGNSEEIGRSSVWDGSIPNCTHQNHLIRVRLDLKRAEPTYISAFLNSSGGRRQLTQFGKTTSGLNTISTSNVKATKILLPPLLEQKKYSLLKQNVTECLNHNHKDFQNTNYLFNSLLQRAFRGEL